MSEIINNLFLYDQLAREQFDNIDFVFRNCYRAIDLSGQITGILGLRGVGKSSYLVSLRKQNPNSLYISCDMAALKGYDLVKLLRELNKGQSIDTVYLDEVSALSDWEASLKNVYDFLDIKVVFSGSSMIDLIKGKYDLSRRAIVYKVPIFSFREFLNIEYDHNIEPIGLDDLLENHVELARQYSKFYAKSLLQKYWKYGQLGYRYKKDMSLAAYGVKLQNSIKKSIYQDLSQFVDVKSTNLSKFEDILNMIASSSSSDVSLNAIGNTVNLSPQVVSKYVEYLSNLGWIIKVNKAGSLSSQIRKKSKLYITGTNMTNLLGKEPQRMLGNMRETFFIDMLNICKQLEPQKIKFFYKDQTDFVLEYGSQKYSIEIGGKSKSRQDCLAVKDDIVVGSGNNIPLWLFGLIA